MSLIDCIQNDFIQNQERIRFLSFCNNVANEILKRGEYVPEKHEISIILKWFNFQPSRGHTKAVNEIISQRSFQKQISCFETNESASNTAKHTMPRS